MIKIINKQGSSLIVIIITVLIIGLIIFMATKNKKQNPNSAFIKEAGIDTSTYKSTLESTKNVLKNAQTSREQLP
jgi:uncharacterized membrane protein YqiK